MCVRCSHSHCLPLWPCPCYKCVSLHEPTTWDRIAIGFGRDLDPFICGYNGEFCLVLVLHVSLGVAGTSRFFAPVMEYVGRIKGSSMTVYSIES